LVVRQALNAIFLVFVYIFLWLLQLPNRTLLEYFHYRHAA